MNGGAIKLKSFFIKNGREYLDDSEKKIRILIALLLGVLIFAIIPRDTVRIENAIVNDNGDIAFTYVDNDFDQLTMLYVYDANGNLLFEDALPDEMLSLYLEFSDDTLNVYQGGSADVVKHYIYTRDGTITRTKIDASLINKNIDWRGWSKKYGKNIYTLGDYQYCYEYTPYPKSLFDSQCVLYINDTSSNTTHTIFTKE